MSGIGKSALNIRISLIFRNFAQKDVKKKSTSDKKFKNPLHSLFYISFGGLHAKNQLRGCSFTICLPSDNDPKHLPVFNGNHWIPLIQNWQMFGWHHSPSTPTPTVAVMPKSNNTRSNTRRSCPGGQKNNKSNT